jgi:hypothetical protein
MILVIVASALVAGVGIGVLYVCGWRRCGKTATKVAGGLGALRGGIAAIGATVRWVDRHGTVVGARTIAVAAGVLAGAGVLGSLFLAFRHRRRRGVALLTFAGGVLAAGVLAGCALVVTGESAAGRCVALRPHAEPPIDAIAAPGTPGTGGTHLGPAAKPHDPTQAAALPRAPGEAAGPTARPHASREHGVGDAPPCVAARG